MATKAPQARAETDHELVMKDFAGVNTQASRTAIAETEFSWLENAMPIGYANIRAIPAQGTAVVTIPSVAINYWQYVNINNTDYLICFTVAGSAHAINLITYNRTDITSAGAFTGTVAIAQWKNERVLIVAANGYWDWDGTTLTDLTGGLSAPTSGQTIATFSGRVWIGLDRTVVFSAPNSYTDFSTAAYGGSFIITDETLHSNITELFVANNFLYVFGESSVNVISDVRVSSGTPASTIFSNTNISSQIGTKIPASVFIYNRSVCFATPYGLYALSGTTPQKISDHLDGIFPLIDFMKPVSAGTANIFDILCMCFSFTYKDPEAGPRPIQALFFNKKWFFSSQGAELTLITGAYQDGTPAIYGTDGSNIWKLYSDSAGAISTTVQTALWSLGYPTKMKEAQKAGVEITTAAIATSLSLSLDSDFGVIPLTLLLVNTGQWINNFSQLGSWINNFGTVGNWVSSQFLIFQGDAEFKGRYLGYTMTSTSPGYELNGLLMQYQVSTPWATKA